MIKDTSAQDVIVKAKPRKSLLLKISFTLIFTALCSFFVYPKLASWSSGDLMVDQSRLRIAKVERGLFVRDLVLQGNIVAANSPKLYAPVNGTVTLLTNPGEMVKQGDKLGYLTSPTLTNQLQQEQSKLESIQIELARQKIANKQASIKSRQQTQLEEVVLDAAKREKKRAELSLKTQSISQLDYEKSLDDLKRSQLKYDFSIEQAELEKENLAFELQTREFELNQYRLLVENTQRQVNELDIIAPVSGIVGAWSVEQKSAVSINQPLITIVDLSALQVEIEIPESYADELGITMSVKINYNGAEYSGSIVTISPQVTNNIVKGRVAFSGEPPQGIKQNQRVSSRVILEEKENVLYLPRGSFTQHHAGLKAFVVKADKAELTPILLGSQSLDKLEIISGLELGQRVIISNTDFVNDATRLKFN